MRGDVSKPQHSLARRDPGLRSIDSSQGSRPRSNDQVSGNAHLGGRFSMKARIPSRGSSDSSRDQDMVC